MGSILLPQVKGLMQVSSCMQRSVDIGFLSKEGNIPRLPFVSYQIANIYNPFEEKSRYLLWDKMLNICTHCKTIGEIFA